MSKIQMPELSDEVMDHTTSIWIQEAIDHGDEPAYVYFVQGARPASYVKIGITRQPPAKRLAALQSGSPSRLRMLAIMPGGLHMERRLHSHFFVYRRHGEWFQPSRELMRLIAAAAERWPL